MHYSSPMRWEAARRIYEMCPAAAEDLDICLSLMAGKVGARALKEDWSRNGKSGGTLSVAYRQAVEAVARIVSRQVAQIEKKLEDDPTADADVRISASLAKTLQVVEDLRQNAEKVVDVDRLEHRDLLEVHRRIIEKIELVIKQTQQE